MELMWLGQSGYLLKEGVQEVCIDPYLSDAVLQEEGRRRLYPPPIQPEELQAQVVVCTHRHLDHLDPDAILRMPLDQITFLAPADCEEILRSLGVRHYRAFDAGTVIQSGKLRLEAVFAAHTVPAVGVLVHAEKADLYFSGDTLYDPGLLSLRNRRMDLALVCINGRLGNMNAEEAARLVKHLGVRVGIPNHYDLLEGNTADPAPFLKGVPFGLLLERGRTYTLPELLDQES